MFSSNDVGAVAVVVAVLFSFANPYSGEIAQSPEHMRE